MLCGIAVLRHMIGVQPASTIWEQGYFAEDVQPEGPCVFCSNPMRPCPAEHGQVWICKACEMVWLDKDALAAMPAAGRTGVPAAAVVAAQGQMHCENCGAPVEHTWDETCPYCGAALKAPTQVVVLNDSTTDRLEQQFHHEKAWKIAGEILGGGVSGLS